MAEPAAFTSSLAGASSISPAMYCPLEWSSRVFSRTFAVPATWGRWAIERPCLASGSWIASITVARSAYLYLRLPSRPSRWAVTTPTSPWNLARAAASSLISRLRSPKSANSFRAWLSYPRISSRAGRSSELRLMNPSSRSSRAGCPRGPCSRA